MPKRDFPPITPGEVLLEEFLRPMGISQTQLSKNIHVPAEQIQMIIQGEKAITPDMALRLSRYFGTTAQFWVNMQATYELEVATIEFGDKINQEISPLKICA